MRIPGLRRDRGDEVYEQLPSQIICPVCGLRNDSMARFCRNCGLPLGAPRDPVRGTTSRRADLPSEHGAGIAAIVGLIAAVVVLAGAGWLILRSNSGPGTSTLPTPTPAVVVTAAPGGSPRPASTGALPSRVPLSSADPGASRDPAGRSPEPTDAPSARPGGAESPAPLVADTGFTCEFAAFDDPSRGTWRYSEAKWGARDKWDELTIVLRREEGKGRTNISVDAMTAREAAQVSGLDPAPTSRVILITFDGDIDAKDPVVVGTINNPNLRALDYLNIESTTQATYAVVGVGRDGCYRLYVPTWKKGDTTAVGDTVNLVLDVKYR